MDKAKTLKRRKGSLGWPLHVHQMTPRGATKKRKLTDANQPNSQAWVQLGTLSLAASDKEAISNGHKLNDCHTNYARKLQYPSLKDMQSLGSEGKKVLVYDSVYSSLDKETSAVISNLFGSS